MRDGSGPAGRPVPGGASRGVCFVAIGALATLSIVLVFILPRPYFVLSNDYDNGHYYNVRSLYEGLPIHNVEHPGTPVFLLGQLAMTKTTAETANVGTFLTVMYVVVGVVTGVSLALFCRLVLWTLPAPAAALALASIAAWPAFLVHLNTFCSESFVLATGLTALAGLWVVLEAFPRPKLRHLAFAGAACGVALSVKLSFIPFVGALALAVTLSVLRSDASLARKARGVLVFLFSIVSVFLAAILPVLHRLDEIILRTLNRPDVVPEGAFLSALGTASHHLLKEQPAIVVLFGVAVLLFVAVASDIATSRAAEGPEVEGGFDVRASVVFFVLLSGAFLYSLACAARDMVSYDSVGDSLRNASPTVLAVPFAVLCFYRVVVPELPERWRDSRTARRGAMLAAIVVAATSLSWHLVGRQTMIQERSRIVAETKVRFEELRRTRGTVAFWDGSPGWLLGEASFHFWGNYRYAENKFTEELRREFPGLAWLHLRDIRYLYEDGRLLKQGTPASERIWWRAPMHDALQHWLALKRRFPAYPKMQPRLFSWVGDGQVPDVLAFPEREAQQELYGRFGLSRGELHSWLEARLGPLDHWTERIGGTEWVFLARTQSGPAPVTSPAKHPAEVETRRGRL